MHLHHKRVRGIIVAVVSVLAITGFSSMSAFANNPEPSVLTYISKKIPTATINVLSHLSLKEGNMQSVVDEFMKEYPTIKIEWRNVPFNALNSTLDANIANKSGNPDVYWADQPRISALAFRGAATDLTSAFSKYKPLFDPSAYKSGIYNGKLWAVPISNSTQLMYYNKDLLKNADIPYPSASIKSRMTWEDVAVAAKKAKDAGAANGLTFGQFDRYYQLQALPMSAGGSTGVTGGDNLTPNITSDAWVKALTWYGGLFKDGTAPRGVTPEQTNALFVAGKTAFAVTGPWLLPDLLGAKINWGVAPHPQFAGGTAVTGTGSWSVAINPFSKNKQAAATFIKWLAIDNGGGYIQYRSNTELAASKKGKTIYFAKSIFATGQGKDAVKIIGYETSRTAISRPSTIGYIEFEQILNAAFSDIRNGADAKEVLTKASDQLSTAWMKYKN